SERGERRVGMTAGFKQCFVLRDRDFDCAVLLTKLSNLVSDLLGRVANGLTDQHRGFRDGQTRWVKFFDCLSTVSVHKFELFWLGLTIDDRGDSFTGGLNIIEARAEGTR